MDACHTRHTALLRLRPLHRGLSVQRPETDGNGYPAGEDSTMPANDDFWKHLTLADYRHIFRGSAVKRAKYEGLMRNIRAFYGEESAENDAPDSL